MIIVDCMLNMHNMVGMISWFGYLNGNKCLSWIVCSVCMVWWVCSHDLLFWVKCMLIMDYMHSMHGMIVMITWFDILSGNICWSWIICSVCMVWSVWSHVLIFRVGIYVDHGLYAQYMLCDEYDGYGAMMNMMNMINMMYMMYISM